MYRAWVADIMATAQQQLAAKLAVCSADGTRVHGNLIETYESEGEPVIRVLDKKTFICECWCRQTNQSTRHAASLPNDSVHQCCVIYALGVAAAQCQWWSLANVATRTTTC